MKKHLRRVMSLMSDGSQPEGKASGWRISFTPQQIESQLRGFFPLERASAGGTWLFSEPSVAIDPVSHRLVLEFDASWGRGERWRLSARIAVSGRFRYAPALATLYLQQLHLEDLRWRGTSVVPLRAAIQVLHLPLGLARIEIPLLQLNGQGFGSRLARSVVQGVDVSHGRLNLLLGLPSLTGTE